MPANKTRAEQGRLELKVEDFGPVVEARLDLRPLTVLVGPNNTGKSYLAILIYTLHRFWNAEIFGPRYLGTRVLRVPPDMVPDASEQAIDDAAKLVFAQWRSERAGKPSPTEPRILPASVAETLSDAYDKRGGKLDGEIRRCFGIEELAALIRRGAQGGADIAVRIHRRDGSAAGGQNFRIGARNAEFRTAMPADAKAPANIRLDELQSLLLGALANGLGARADEWHRELLANFGSDLLNFLATAVRPSVVGPLARDAVYLPADRTGLVHAHNVMMSALSDGAAMSKVRPIARTPALPGVLGDFLEDLVDLGQRPGAHRRPPRDLGGGIEKTVLKGAIRVERWEAASYPRLTYRPEGRKASLPLAGASSMVSELAPVVLFLRHRVEPGNLLIIEEPEAHLHPATQVQLMREIAALVQAGVRVIAITHSEWMLEELANIVGRAALSEPEGAALPASDVGVWLFEPKERPKGSVVREIPLDESGQYPTGFEEVAAALHNDRADIVGRSREPGRWGPSNRSAR